MTEQQPRTIGIFGVGRVGTAIARAAMAKGDTVFITGTQDPVTQQMLLDFVAPGAIAASPEEVAAADLIVVAVPLPKFRAVSPELLRGKVVVDAMNYWSGTDGSLADFDDTELSSSEVVAEHFAGAHVVKTFNHVGYRDLDPAVIARRETPVGLGVAGDDADAVAAVTEFVERLGFAAVAFDSLAAGRAFEPSGPIFGGLLAADELRARLAGVTVR